MTAVVYSPQLLSHFQNPQNAGELPAPARLVEVSNPACGDTLRLSVRWDTDGRAVESRFKVRGCTASVAAGSALTLLIIGKTRAQLDGLRAADIEAELGGLPPESKHAAALCVDAIRAVLAMK